ncbi:MAG: hypothetical protein Q7T87_21960 [Polaromonas sp.]|nr:hypothetical protein [Polaromonas sp.]
MKRPLAANETRPILANVPRLPQMPQVPLVPLVTQTPIGTAASRGRRTYTNGKLDSLADPISGASGSLVQLLRTYASGSNTSGGAMDAGREAQAILDLDATDRAPSLTIAPACMGLLLALGQARLMCRLAELCAVPYVLGGADDRRMAEVLVRASLAWPVNSAVTLILSNSTLHEDMALVQPFLPIPRELKVKFLAYNTQRATEAQRMAEVLKTRPCFDELTLVGGPHALETFRALIGVRAKTLTFATPPTATQPDPVRWSAFEPVIVALVQKAGGHTLRILNESMPELTVARLVASAPAWTCVLAPLSPALLGVGKSETRIQQLELTLLPNSVLEPTTQLMDVLRSLRTQTLVVHGPVNLARFAQALDDFARASSFAGTLLVELRACFLLPLGADVDIALAQLARDVRVETLTPETWLIHAADYSQLDRSAIQRIQAQNQANKTAVLERVNGRGGVGRTTAWSNTVHALGALLAPDRQVGGLLDYLKSTDNTLMRVPDRPWVTPEVDALATKLKHLPTHGINEDLVRAAIEQRLRQHPEDIESTCKALIISQFPLSVRPPDTWLTASIPHRRYRTHALHRTGVMGVTGLVGAGAVLPTAPAATTTTSTHTAGITTTTTTTPTTTTTMATNGSVGVVVEPGYLAAAASRRAYAVSLVEPAGEQSLTQLLRQVRMLAERRVPTPDREIALRLVDRLLCTGEVSLFELEIARETITLELMELGQFKLLRFMAALGVELTINATLFPAAPGIGCLANLPCLAGERYRLLLSSSAADNMLTQALAFAHSVPPIQLKLVVKATVNTPATFWSTLAAFVRGHPGLYLELTQDWIQPLSTQHWMAFLPMLRQTSLRGFGMASGFHKVRSEFHEPLLTTIGSTGAKALSLGVQIDAVLAQKLLVSRPWDILELQDPSEYLALFRAGAVSARTLRLHAGWMRGTPVDEVIGACKGLEILEFTDKRVSFSLLSALLSANPGIHTVKCAIDSEGLLQDNSALRRLMHRPPVSIEMTNDDPSLKPKLFEVTNAGVVAGYRFPKAFGFNRMLEMLSPNASYDVFKTTLLAALTPQSPFHEQARTRVDTYPKHPVLGRVMDMHRACFSVAGIVQLIGLQLAEQPMHTPQLMEALALVGAIAPREWLMLGYGIDLSPMPLMPQMPQMQPMQPMQPEQLTQPVQPYPASPPSQPFWELPEDWEQPLDLWF